MCENVRRGEIQNRGWCCGGATMTIDPRRDEGSWSYRGRGETREGGYWRPHARGGPRPRCARNRLGHGSAKAAWSLACELGGVGIMEVSEQAGRDNEAPITRACSPPPSSYHAVIRLISAASRCPRCSCQLRLRRRSNTASHGSTTETSSSSLTRPTSRSRSIEACSRDTRRSSSPCSTSLLRRRQT